MNTSPYEEGRSRLRSVAESLRKGDSPQKATVRELLGWFGQQRRGWRVVSMLKGYLHKMGLATDPDFATAYIDGHLTFSLLSEERASPDPGGDGRRSDTADTKRRSSDPRTSEGVAEDPVLRVRMLPAANRAPVSVNRDDPVSRSLTLMMMHDFSQLPVTQDMRSIDGMVSWRSILIARAKDVEPKRVGECIERHEEVRADDALLTAFQKIVDHDVVLVRGQENRITGIVTATDLSLMFREQTEPFLLLSEIENQLRHLIDGRFSPEEMQDAKDPKDGERDVEGVTDLTFGECVRLLQEQEHWERLQVRLDHKTVVAQLSEVRRIRNDVMHFDPDGLSNDDLQRLRDVRRLLQRVR